MRRLLRFIRQLRYSWSRDRMNEIEEAMYYEQADRDGCEYPPQWINRR